MERVYHICNERKEYERKKEVLADPSPAAGDGIHPVSGDSGLPAFRRISFYNGRLQNLCRWGRKATGSLCGRFRGRHLQEGGVAGLYHAKGRLLLTYLLTIWHPHSYKSEKQRLLSKSKRITADYL